MALKEVLIDELCEIYSGESQLVKALPKLAKGSIDLKLKELFTGHLEETKGQVLRLKQVFEQLEEKPTRALQWHGSVIEEGAGALEKDEYGASFDSGSQVLRFGSTRISGRDAFVRELRAQDMKFELEGLQQGEAVAIGRLMAAVVGRAHGRQLTAVNLRAWVNELKNRYTDGLDAPRWLWGSVMDLATLRHEKAYLKHCRRCALVANKD